MTSNTDTANDISHDLATSTWLAVVQTYNECSTTLSHRLGPLGLSLLEHEVLMNLLRSDRLTQKQLSERCFSAKSGISMLISRFESSGLVQRRKAESDQRAWLLSLTPAGHSLAEKARSVQLEVVSAMAAPFSKAELSLVKLRMEAAGFRLRELRAGHA